MADNVTKKDIIIEAKTVGFETAEKKIERTKKAIDELEAKNEQAKRNLKSGKVSNRGKFFTNMHIAGRKKQIKAYKEEIREAKSHIRKMERIRSKADTVEIARLVNADKTKEKRALEIRQEQARKINERFRMSGGKLKSGSLGGLRVSHFSKQDLSALMEEAKTEDKNRAIAKSKMALAKNSAYKNFFSEKFLGGGKRSQELSDMFEHYKALEQTPKRNSFSRNMAKYRKVTQENSIFASSPKTNKMLLAEQKHDKKQEAIDLKNQEERLAKIRAYRKKYDAIQSAKIKKTVFSQFDKSPELKNMASYYGKLEKTSLSDSISRESHLKKGDIVADRFKFARLDSDQQKVALERIHEQAQLEDSIINHQRAVNKAKEEEAEEARKAKEIESNYVKSKKRMQAYAKKGRKSNIRRQKNLDREANTPYRYNIMEGRAGFKGLKKRSTLEWGDRAWKKLDTGLAGVGNTATMAVGQLTMFAGAITMVGFMAGSAFQKVIALGDAFAEVEKDLLVSGGFRNSLLRAGGMNAVKDFDAVVRKERLYSGRTTMQSGAFLGRAGNALRNYGGTVNGSSIENLMMSAHGIAGITGDESEAVIEKVLDLAKSGKGKDATKLGLQELKLSKNMNENLDIIANAVKKDPIASTILKRGTIGGSMATIKNAPRQLMERVMSAHKGQIHSMFSGLAKVLDDTANNPRVIKAWSKTLTNLEEELSRVFTPEKMEKFAINMAIWGAILIKGFGKVMDGVMWISENHETVIDALKKFGAMWVALQAVKIGKDATTIVQGIWAVANAIIGAGKKIFEVPVPTTPGGTPGQSIAGKAGAFLGKHALKLGVLGGLLFNSEEAGGAESNPLRVPDELKLRKGLSQSMNGSINGTMPHVKKPIDYSLNPNPDHVVVRQQPPTSQPNAVVYINGNFTLSNELLMSTQSTLDSAGSLVKGW